MSLASLLNFGKKEGTDEAPIPSCDDYVPEEIKRAEAEKKPALNINSEELKMALELADAQSKALEPEYERQRLEEEAKQKAQFTQAAQQAAVLARKAKAATAAAGGDFFKAQIGGMNPFSTGGSEFKKGVFVCDTAFGAPKPMGARSHSLLEDNLPNFGMGGDWGDHDRSRSPSRGGSSADSSGWGGCGGAAGFGKGGCGWAPDWAAMASMASMSMGKGAWGGGGGAEAWGGGDAWGGKGGGAAAWGGAPAWEMPAMAAGYGKGAGWGGEAGGCDAWAGGGGSSGGSSAGAWSGGKGSSSASPSWGEESWKGGDSSYGGAKGGGAREREYEGGYGDGW